MTWTAVPVEPEKVTAEYLYTLSKRHRLVPENLAHAIDYYRNVASGCKMIEVRSGDDAVGELLITNIVDGDSAQIDFVPKPSHFAPGAEYEDDMQEAVLPVLRRLMELRDLRRITAMVPKSRSRTFKALRACGFNKEGVMRDAIKFTGQPVEDVVIMGLLAAKE